MKLFSEHRKVFSVLLVVAFLVPFVANAQYGGLFRSFSGLDIPELTYDPSDGIDMTELAYYLSFFVK